MAVEQKFTTALQERLITLLFNYKHISKPLMPAIEPNTFSNPPCQLVIRLAKDYYDRYKDLPSKTTLLDLLAKEGPRLHLSDAELKQLAKVMVLISRNNVPKEDLPYLKDELIELIKYSKLKGALFDAMSHFQNGDIASAMAAMQGAKRAEVTSDLGREYFADFEKRLSERLLYSGQMKVPTLLEPLDEVLNGGLGPGELGIAMGPPGTGKSMFLINLGFAGVLHKHATVHITLEMSALQTLSRYDSVFTGCPISQLSKNSELLKEKMKDLQKFQNLLFVKQFPPRTCKVPMITTYLEQLRNEGVNPSLLTVDYGDLLAPTRRYDQVRHELTSIFEELRRVAVEYDMAVWTATQSNRQSLGQYNVTEKHVSEAFSKVMICDVLLSLNQTPNEEQLHKMRIKLLKVRDSVKGLSFPVVADFAHARYRVAENYSKLDCALGTRPAYEQ